MQFYNPENFKQGELIMSRYYPKELAVIIISVIISLGLTLVVGSVAIGVGKPLLLVGLFLLSLLPAGCGFFLMNPLEGYHNAYYYFKLKIRNQKVQKRFMWEGVQFDDTGDVDDYE